MKAAVFYGYHDLRVEERKLTPPAPGEVRIRVKACGVCGTDVHIYEGDQGSVSVLPPLIIGHEFAGIVDEVGAGVSTLRPGDHVCADPNIVCGGCDPCREGNTNFCENIVGVGTMADGGFAEFCTLPERAFYSYSNLDFVQAAMCEPLACCLHGTDLAGIRPGSHVLIIGGGAIGLIMVQLARLCGAAGVALLEPDKAKRALGRTLGADAALNPLCENVPDALVRLGLRRIDVTIECVGLPETMRNAVEYTSKGGTVLWFGLTKPGVTIAVYPFDDIFRKELTIKGSFINPKTQKRAISLLEARRVDVTSLIGACLPLDEINRAFTEPGLRSRGKVVILP